MAMLRQAVPDIEDLTQVTRLSGGVDLDACPFSPREPGRDLAWVGEINHDNSPTLLLDCFHRLHREDAACRLFIAGVFADDALQAYLLNAVAELGLAEAVRFDGWQADMPAWLADKHYVVSTRLIQAVPQEVLKGMACGLKPLVHTYPGCHSVLPDEYLFSSSEEFCRLVTEGAYEPESYRRFVAERYDVKADLRRMAEVLRSVEARVPRAEEKAPTGVVAEAAPVGTEGPAR
jgi:glycosyltransferase involved in cell wall biosynthesis